MADAPSAHPRKAHQFITLRLHLFKTAGIGFYLPCIFISIATFFPCSNKSSKSLSRNDKRKFSECSNKYNHEDEIVLKQLLKKSKNYSIEEKDKKLTIGDLASSISSYGRNLKSIQLDQLNAREISTQTFPMLDPEEKGNVEQNQLKSL